MAVETREGTPPGGASPAGWPPELLALFERAVTVEYASRTRSGDPVTVPVTPYLGEDGRTLDVSTGLTYPVKAERARRDPRVALLFSDALGTGLERAPVVLVQGLATVRDADLQAGTDRYVRLSMAKAPEVYAGQPGWLLRTLSWYFARIWIQVTPTRMLWWPEGRLDAQPREWKAPLGTQAAPSDPAPSGPGAAGVLTPPADWRPAAAEAAGLPTRDLTVVGADGFPVVLPVRELAPVPEGFRLQVAPGAEPVPAGPACLTFHAHSVPFTAQQNRSFAGALRADEGGSLTFGVQRQLADWSIPTGRVRSTVDFLGKGRRLRPRLRAEAARRGQTPPVVNLPPTPA